MRRPYHQGLTTPRPGERNKQATFQEAVGLGRELTTTLNDLALQLEQDSSLIEHSEFPKIGYEFFANYFSPLKLWLFATDKNIAYLAKFVGMRDLDGLVYFIKNECQDEFVIDAKQDPEDRQFSDAACEFLANLAPIEFLQVRES